MVELTGRAYGFVHCEFSKDDITRRIPDLRIASRTPSKLEISLMDVEEVLQDDKDLLPVVEEAKKSGLNYVFKGTYLGNSNNETASELSQFLMQANQSGLNKRDEFWGRVIYKELEAYVFFD